MKLSAFLTLWMSLAFALLCVAYAGYGWVGIDAMPAGAERNDAHGFVLFWLFLGAVGLACAGVSWRMTRRLD